MRYIQGALTVSSVLFVTLSGGSISVHLNILFLKVFIYLLLAVLSRRCCMGFSLVAVLGLLIAVASLVVKHGL